MSEPQSNTCCQEEEPNLLNPAIATESTEAIEQRPANSCDATIDDACKVNLKVLNEKVLELEKEKNLQMSKIEELQKENQAMKAKIAHLEGELRSERRQSGLLFRQASHSEELLQDILCLPEGIYEKRE